MMIPFDRQWTLGQLIAAIEPVSRTWRWGDDPTEFTEIKPQLRHVSFKDFPASPIGLCSYRGYYNSLAIVPSCDRTALDIDAFLQLLKDADGSQFTGWKGGEYCMTLETPLFVAAPGVTGGFGVTGIDDSNKFELGLLVSRVDS